MVNIDPPDDLADHRTSDYRGAYRECIVPKFAEFEEYVDEYKEDLEDHIEQEREHRRLINFCIFPFVQSNPPEGYKFVRADPLEELDLPNFDFLLHDLEGRVILGEAKASLPTNTASEINDLIEQVETFYEEKEYIEDNYLGTEIIHTEFVLATYTDYASKASRTILEKGEEIVTWQVNRFSDTLNVEKDIPSSVPENIESDSVDEALEEVRRRALHDVPGLNEALNGCPTASGSVSVFPRSAIVDKLRIVIRAYKSDGRYTFVNYEDLKQEVRNGALNYEEERINDITDRIVSEGLSIGLLEEWDDDRGDYKVVSRYTSREGIEKTLKNKWIKAQIEKRKEDMREECKKYARRKAGAQAELGEFT